MVEILKIVVIPATGTFEPGLLPFGITTLKLPSPSTMKLPHLAGSAALTLLPNENRVLVLLRLSLCLLKRCYFQSCDLIE